MEFDLRAVMPILALLIMSFAQYLPLANGQTTITVNGTSANDTIVVDETSTCATYTVTGKVTINNVVVSSLCGFDGDAAHEFIIYGKQGSDTITVIDGGNNDEYYVYDGAGKAIDINTINDGPGDDHYSIYMDNGDDSAVINDSDGSDEYYTNGGNGKDAVTLDDTCSDDHYEFYGGSGTDTFTQTDCSPDMDSFLLVSVP